MYYFTSCIMRHISLYILYNQEQSILKAVRSLKSNGFLSISTASDLIDQLVHYIIDLDYLFPDSPQDPTEKYIGKNFVCPKHPLLQTGTDRPGLTQKFPCILAVIMLYYE